MVGWEGTGQEQREPVLGMVSTGPHGLALPRCPGAGPWPSGSGQCPCCPGRCSPGAPVPALAPLLGQAGALTARRHLLGQCTQHRVVLEPSRCPVGGGLAPPGTQLGACWGHRPWAERLPGALDPRPALPALPPSRLSPLSSRATPKAPSAMAAAWRGPVLGRCGHLHAQPHGCGLCGGGWQRLSSEFYRKMYSRSYLQ